MSATFRTLIVGFGNPVRSDDGVGWHVARQLADSLLRDDVRVVAAHQLLPEMAELASRAERVLFIDAAQAGDPGSIACETIHASAALEAYTHELSPEAVLAVAKELYGRSPAAFLLTVAGESFATGDALTPKVSAAIPALLARVRQFIHDEM